MQVFLNSHTLRLGGSPTASAFRYYVEQMTRPDAQLGRVGLGGAAVTAIPSSGIPLSEQRREQIEDSYAGLNSSK